MKWRILAPIVIFAVGVVMIAGLVATKPPIEKRVIEVPRPVVRVETVKAEPVRFSVAAQGTVVPRRQSSLVSQVAGEVVWTSPAFVAGGFFEEDEPLLRIDAADYEAELESARASVARAESEARRAAKELGRQRRLAEGSVSSEARIDDAENQNRVAQAGLREAKARMGRAERDLERTEVRAPYPGRVRSEGVDVGQFVSRGAPLAEVYAVDYAEVRLPVPDRELRFLDLPLGRRGTTPVFDSTADSTADATAEATEEAADAQAAVSGPAVALSADFAGQGHTWRGQIVRTEGEIDPRSRMVTVVARVEDPYGHEATAAAGAPLAVGLFVSAQIEGVEVERAVVLPRTALRGDGEVFVVDDEGRLRLRSVEVLRQERDRVVVGSGLAEGEQVCVSPMPSAIDGMRVEVLDEGNLARSGA